MQYNLSILDAHRQFVKSHDEMEALRTKMEENNKRMAAENSSNINNKLDSVIEQLKREING